MKIQENKFGFYFFENENMEKVKKYDEFDNDETLDENIKWSDFQEKFDRNFSIVNDKLMELSKKLNDFDKRMNDFDKKLSSFESVIL
jgi:hypothetical protein